MTLENERRAVRRARRTARSLAACALVAGLGLFSSGAGQSGAETPPPKLEETRLILGKWIETQQILSKEQNDWQQGKEILVGRLDLVKREIAGLEEKIAAAQASVAETNAKRDALQAESAEFEAAGAQLANAVGGMELETRKLFASLPDPLQTKLQPLRQRIPEDAAGTRVTVAERFQNVLGILNEVNKANNELSVEYEVRNLADGKPQEVRTLYVGLGQAYYVSAGGEAGIGRPAADGWKWEPSKEAAADVLTALEIIQGKHTPAFVPLPVRLQ